MRRFRWYTVALFLFLFMVIEARGISHPFDEDAPFHIESVAPVLNNDVHRAHRQALSSGFRQALSKSLAETGMGGLAQERSNALINPERYIHAYQIEEQSRRDLFYRLTILIWVNRQLLMKEVWSDRGITDLPSP